MGSKREKRNEKAETEKAGNGQRKETHVAKTSLADAGNGKPVAGSEPAPLGTADGPYPYPKKMKTKRYEKTLLKLQIELLKVQAWAKEMGEKIVIVFEGRDAAGKGGTIKRFREHLNPRFARNVALNKPSDAERGQWYFQRYIAQFPTAGEIVFFDRSWYNRGGVEPVMGFCTPEEYMQFMRQVPNVEQGLMNGGIRLIKLWFDVGRDEQRRRIESRKTDPLKRWKLSPMDFESMKRWDDYTKARDSVFFHSHTTVSPWLVVRSDDKKRARINAIRTVLCILPYPDKDPKVVVPPDPLIVGTAAEMFPLEGRVLFGVTRT